MPSATLEEYLEAIYKLGTDGPVRPGRIAEEMSVSAPTVTATLRRLAAQGLIRRDKGAVLLTEEGEREALSILRRHRLAERFLVDVLGLPWDQVHEDACRLEHAMSPRVQAALAEFLEHPDVCPHGHPIPDQHLAVPEPSTGDMLYQVPKGATVRVVKVDEQDPEAVSEAARAGLLPGTQCRIEQQVPEGAILVSVEGKRVEVTPGLARRIHVSIDG
ncbi:MAG: metal-dependent transcriptional regulator [Coriobacteriia bacterium]